MSWRATGRRTLDTRQRSRRAATAGPPLHLAALTTRCVTRSRVLATGDAEDRSSCPRGRVAQVGAPPQSLGEGRLCQSPAFRTPTASRRQPPSPLRRHAATGAHRADSLHARRSRFGPASERQREDQWWRHPALCAFRLRRPAMSRHGRYDAGQGTDGEARLRTRATRQRPPSGSEGAGASSSGSGGASSRGRTNPGRAAPRGRGGPPSAGRPTQSWTAGCRA
jgi:hypothetical protein